MYAIALAFRIALLFGWNGELDEVALRRECRDLFGWQTVRAMAFAERDPERRLALMRAWPAFTVDRADDLLPAYHPVWPLYRKWDVWVRDVQMLPKERDRLRAYWTAEGYPVPDEEERAANSSGWCLTPPYPPLWSYLALTVRDLARQWAIVELALTGRPDPIRAQIIAWCEQDVEMFTWGEDLTDAGGQFKLDAYITTLLYDPGLLNRRYFDGRRIPRPPPTGDSVQH